MRSTKDIENEMQNLIDKSYMEKTKYKNFNEFNEIEKTYIEKMESKNLIDKFYMEKTKYKNFIDKPYIEKTKSKNLINKPSKERPAMHSRLNETHNAIVCLRNALRHVAVLKANTFITTCVMCDRDFEYIPNELSYATCTHCGGIFMLS